jgi:hypothetical protein
MGSFLGKGSLPRRLAALILRVAHSARVAYSVLALYFLDVRRWN